MVFLTAVVVLAGLSPVAAAAPGGADAVVEPAPVEATMQTADNESAPADPESDRLGWENGYWHNETIDVDQSDGLTEAELNATVSRSMARVEMIRGLEFDMDVPVRIITRSEFASSGNASYSDDFLTFDDTKFEALFLIGEDEDSIEVQDANRGASVGGYYSPAADSIVLVTDNESTLQVDELTLGHELVHAIQDQEFDLSTVTSQTRDGANANSGLIEGDANYVQQRYRERCAEGGEWADTCLSPSTNGSGGGATPPNMGVYFLNYQPYSDGPTFIGAQRAAGGWERVNSLYGDLPASAEQVIHPDRYRSDAPTEVELADEHGEGWERVTPESRLDYAEVGQSGVAAMFVYPLYAGGGDVQTYARNVVGPQTWLNYTESGEISQVDPLNYGFDAAAGWDGDRMHFYRNADGETGYVWRLVWDSPEEATEFRAAYEELLSYWGAEQVGTDTYRIDEDASAFADAFHVTVEGDTVTVVNAPTVDSLSAVRSSTDAQLSTPTATPSPAATDAAGTDTETPSTEGTGSDSATTTSAPGFSVVAALAGLLTVALLAGRR
ncbi:Hvo_1808 family surface protein [Halolamina litorea]